MGCLLLGALMAVTLGLVVQPMHGQSQNGNCDDLVADIVFVLDASGSVQKDNFAKMLDFVKEIAQSFKIATDKVRIGLFTFAGDTNVEFYLDRYSNKGGVIRHLKRVLYTKGATHTQKALNLLPDEMFNGRGNRPDVPDIVILLSDGKSNEPKETLAAIPRVKNENYTIFTLGIGNGIDKQELNAISSDPDSTYSLDVQTFDDLVDILQNFTQQVCSVPTPPTTPTIGECGNFVADLVFVLDSSGSIDQSDFDKMLDFVKKIVQSVKIATDNVRIGLFTFSDDTNIEFHLNTYSNQGGVLSHLNKVGYLGGKTFTDKALNLLTDEMFADWNGNRPGVPDIVILLSDGESTDPRSTLAAIPRVKREKYTIFTLGIGPNTDKAELYAISSDPDSTYSSDLDTFDDLSVILQTFTEEVCSIPYVPPPPPISGSCEDFIADLVLVLDASGSVGQSNFEKMLDFVRKIIQSLKIANDKVRVGLFTFATKASVTFYLDTYSNQIDMINHVKRVPYTQGYTNTDKALNLLPDEMFNGHGNRPDVPDIVVLFSDGESAEPNDTLEAISRVRKENYTIFTVGIGKNIDKEELDKISSEPDDIYSIEVESFDDLAGILDAFSTQVCEETNIPSCGEAVADIVIVLDSSGSIELENFIKVKDFLVKIIQQFTISADGVRVGLLRFATDVSVEFYLDSYSNKGGVLAGIRDVYYSKGETHTDKALRVLRENMLNGHGNRDDVADIVIFLSDGRSTNHQQTQDEIEKLKMEDYTVFTIGIGNNIDTDELNAISSDPDSFYSSLVTDFDALEDIRDAFTAKACEATIACRQYADLVIMIDVSTSIGATNLKRVKDLVKDIVKWIQVDDDKVRVALVTFDLIAQIKFKLDGPSDQQDVLDRIDQISGPSYGSWPARAFRVIRTEVLQQSAGDRPDAHDIILFISDGLARDPETTILEAEKLKENGAKIITIGTDGHNRNALRALSSAPSEDFSFAVSNFDGSDRIQQLLQDKSCGNRHCGVEADIIVIMDSSTSISEDHFKEMREFLKHLLSGFEIGPDHVRVGLATFNYDAVMVFQLNTFVTKQQVLRAVDAISGQGTDTRTDKALKLVREVMFTEENGNRIDVPDVILLFTDGRSRDREKTIQEAMAVHHEGITVFSVGIGSHVSDSELRAIASAPYDDHVYQVKDFMGLSAIEGSLQRKTCGVPPVMNPDGIKIQADIVFVFDCSDEVTMVNFKWALTFASKIVKSMRVGKRWARFGAIKFSADAVLEMTLDSYFTRPDILAAIQGIQKSGWGSRVEKALRQLRTLAFKDCLGGRAEAPDVAIFFTSGAFTHVDVARYESMLAQNSGMRIFAIGIGSQVDKFELEILTSSPYSTSVFIVRSEQDMHTIHIQLMQQLNSVFNVCH